MKTFICLLFFLVFSISTIAQNFFPLSTGYKYQIKRNIYPNQTEYREIIISSSTVVSGKTFYNYDGKYLHFDENENKLYILRGGQIKLAADFNAPADSFYISYLYDYFGLEMHSYGITSWEFLGETRMRYSLSYYYCSPPGPEMYCESISYKFYDNVGIGTFNRQYEDPYQSTAVTDWIIAIENDTLTYNPFEFSIALVSAVEDRPINQFPYQIIAGTASNYYNTFIDSVFAEFYVFREDTNLVHYNKFPFTGVILTADVTLDSTILSVGDLVKFRCVLVDKTIFRGRHFDPDSAFYQFNVLSAVSGVVNDVLNNYQLRLSNYPNPFNPSTQIEFFVPTSSIVSLSVYDVLGKEISKLVNRFLIGGKHIVTFSADNLPSGIYLCRLQTSKSSIYRKMILIK